ncbi:MAG: hypothetical protein AAFX06_12345 [Planctomycetota bacterium]
MTKSLLCMMVFLTISLMAAAEEIEFLQPDGSAAKDLDVYRTVVESHGSAGGDMMGMMMGGGMDEMDAGGGLGGMGMGAAGTGKASPRTRIDFLGTNPLDGALAERVSLTDGKLKLEREHTFKSKDSVRHAGPLLAVHATGYCFIPPNSRLRSKVKLREPGTIRVQTPTGLDVKRFRVLTCWQNGFASPSTNEEIAKQGIQAPPCLDDNDWRFTARFRVFNVGELEQDIRVPPGEVRVAIVPHEIQGTPLGKIRSGESLLKHMLHRGPSRIVVVTGREKEPVVVHMLEPKAVTFKIPKSKESSLPLWDGAPETKYYLVPQVVDLPKRWTQQGSGMGDPFDTGMGMGSMGMGGMGMGGDMDDPFAQGPPESRLESIRRWSALLNDERPKRSFAWQIREASSITETTVRFDLIQPQYYRFIRVDDDSLVTHYHRVGRPSKDGSMFEMVPSSNKVNTLVGVGILLADPNGLPAAAGIGSPPGSSSLKGVGLPNANLPNANLPLPSAVPQSDLGGIPSVASANPFGATGGTANPFGATGGTANPFGATGGTGAASANASGIRVAGNVPLGAVPDFGGSNNPFGSSSGASTLPGAAGVTGADLPLNVAGPFGSPASGDSPFGELPEARTPELDSGTPGSQLATIRKMRGEIEAVIKKMSKHRDKLIELEKRLSQGSSKSPK